MHVLASTGQVLAPADAIRKVGGGEPVLLRRRHLQRRRAARPGRHRRRARHRVPAAAGLRRRRRRSGAVEVDLPLERWIRLPEEGWYAGNTHVHYDEKETRALDRLRLDPRVEDLPVFVVSHLKRRELAYASNAFPIGRHALSTPEHVIDVGEESRHNDTPWRIGLGHIMLINIRAAGRAAQPRRAGRRREPGLPAAGRRLRRGARPGRRSCSGATTRTAWRRRSRPRSAGSTASTCSTRTGWTPSTTSGTGCSTAACGCRPRPARTGSSARATASTSTSASEFCYDAWLAGLRDGPHLRHRRPGAAAAGRRATPWNELLGAGAATRHGRVEVEWAGAQPVDRVEIVRDGEVAPATKRRRAPRGVLRRGRRRRRRLGGRARLGAARTSYGHALWAHTSPVYLRPTPAPADPARGGSRLRGPGSTRPRAGSARRGGFIRRSIGRGCSRCSRRRRGRYERFTG